MYVKAVQKTNMILIIMTSENFLFNLTHILTNFLVSQYFNNDFLFKLRLRCETADTKEIQAQSSSQDQLERALASGVKTVEIDKLQSTIPVSHGHCCNHYETCVCLH